MSLQNLQAEFIELLSSNNASGDLFHPSEHIHIYHNNITHSLVKSLQNAYPKIQKILGHHFFENAAKEYIVRYPSTSSNLNEYGAYFSDFLRFFEPAAEFEYLPEVATFEWAAHELYVAPDAGTFSLNELGKYSPESYPKLHFVLSPACKILHFNYPIVAIIDLCRNPAQGPVDLTDGGLDLLLIRAQDKIKLIPLSPSEYTFLLALNFNQSLSVALDATLSSDNQFLLEESLPKWVQDGVIVDFYLQDA